MIKVAVKLPDLKGEVGEYLADATALEAAGADAVWVEDTASEPWVMLGALAAVTHRIGLGCLLTSPGSWPVTQLSSAGAALQVLSRGRVTVGLPNNGLHDDRIAALQASGVRIFSTSAGAAPPGGVIVAVESADQLNPPEAGIEVWAAIAAPPDRGAWSSTLNAYQAAGATGVIVPWNARLIDLLRNPEPDDRSDLLIATG